MANENYFYLSPKEEATMKVLWNTDRALSAAEIAEQIPDRTWPASSIQSILRTLEKKEAICVDSITKLGKSYGRLFRPSLSANEYATMQFLRFYQSDEADCFSIVSAILENISADKDNIIKNLKDIITKYE